MLLTSKTFEHMCGELEVHGVLGLESWRALESKRAHVWGTLGGKNASLAQHFHSAIVAYVDVPMAA